MSVTTALSFLVVGACWGCTTPFIKNGTSGNSSESNEDAEHKQSRLQNVLSPLRSLARIKAAVPFLLNQSGSLLFYVLLSSQGVCFPPTAFLSRYIYGCSGVQFVDICLYRCDGDVAGGENGATPSNVAGRGTRVDGNRHMCGE
ncbi:unnamed protein product [Sphacelaria rigidula]